MKLISKWLVAIPDLYRDGALGVQEEGRQKNPKSRHSTGLMRQKSILTYPLDYLRPCAGVCTCSRGWG